MVPPGTAMLDCNSSSRNPSQMTELTWHCGPIYVTFHLDAWFVSFLSHWHFVLFLSTSGTHVIFGSRVCHTLQGWWTYFPTLTVHWIWKHIWLISRYRTQFCYVLYTSLQIDLLNHTQHYFRALFHCLHIFVPIEITRMGNTQQYYREV